MCIKFTFIHIYKVSIFRQLCVTVKELLIDIHVFENWHILSIYYLCSWIQSTLIMMNPVGPDNLVPIKQKSRYQE